jgi:hypothetical protein
MLVRDAGGELEGVVAVGQAAGLMVYIYHYVGEGDAGSELEGVVAIGHTAG